jgi:hypothetical protein
MQTIDFALESSWTPVDEVDGALGVDDGKKRGT